MIWVIVVFQVNCVALRLNVPRPVNASRLSAVNAEENNLTLPGENEQLNKGTWTFQEDFNSERTFYSVHTALKSVNFRINRIEVFCSRVDGKKWSRSVSNNSLNTFTFTYNFKPTSATNDKSRQTLAWMTRSVAYISSVASKPLQRGLH